MVPVTTFISFLSISICMVFCLLRMNLDKQTTYMYFWLHITIVDSGHNIFFCCIMLEGFIFTFWCFRNFWMTLQCVLCGPCSWLLITGYSLIYFFYVQIVPACQNLYKNSFTYHCLQDEQNLAFDDAIQFLGE